MSDQTFSHDDPGGGGDVKGDDIVMRGDKGEGRWQVPVWTLHPAALPTSPFCNGSRQLVHPSTAKWEVSPVDDGGQETEEKLLRDGDKREQPQVVEQQYPERSPYREGHGHLGVLGGRGEVRG